MTWDLVCLKPNPHRAGDDAFYVLIKKASHRQKGKSVVHFSVSVAPLPFVATGETTRLTHMEESTFRAIVDLEAQSIVFDIAKADSALPSLLRGGGLGSLAISELIIWAKRNYPTFTVALSKVSGALLNYPNAVTISEKCLLNFGFAVGKSGSGLQFKGETVEALRPHVNKNKVEAVPPAQLYKSLIQDQVHNASLLLEANQELSAARERLYQSQQATTPAAPFVAGLLAGLVAGAALAAVIFNV